MLVESFRHALGKAKFVNLSVTFQDTEKAKVTSFTPTSGEETDSKRKLSRRAFLKRLALVGSIVAASCAGAVGTFLLFDQNVISPVLSEIAPLETRLAKVQVILDPNTNLALKTSGIPENQSKNFVYPRTGNPEQDSNTFSQCIVVHLPKGLTAPANLSTVDPISGDKFIAFSRVCVHLWCLCSYNSSSQLLECPCHGSNYVPGSGSPYFDPPGLAVSGPASQQPSPNNTLPVILLSVAPDGTLSATGIVGQIGCGQKC